MDEAPKTENGTPTPLDIEPPGRSLMVKNLFPGLVERGKIKIGRKGHMTTSRGGTDFQPPVKLDHFVVTTLARDDTGNFIRDEEIHKTLGNEPKRIPVRLLFDDPGLNFQSRYAAFKGRTLWCAGDGETAMRLVDDKAERERVQCPCHRQDPTYEGKDKCKINGTLSVIIDGAECVGGVWKFRTTSYNSVTGLMSSLALIQRITGGVLAGIPLVLTLNPKTVVTPVQGTTQTVYVVGLEYEGAPEALQKIGYEMALNSATHHARIDQIEDQARRLLLPSPEQVMAGDVPSEVVEEWYPDGVYVTDENGAVPVPEERPRREDYKEPAVEDDQQGEEADQTAPAEETESAAAAEETDLGEPFVLCDEFGNDVGQYDTAENYLDAAGAYVGKEMSTAKGAGKAFHEHNQPTLDRIAETIGSSRDNPRLASFYSLLNGKRDD